MSPLSLYLLAGLGAGVIAGLFGVGGGLILVPVLIWTFQQQGFAPEIIVHLALGTSLAVIIATSLSSIWAHQRRGAILWPVCLQLTPGLMLGALCGAYLAKQLPGFALSRIFALFELFIAWHLLHRTVPALIQPTHLPRWPLMVSAGVGIGMISAIVGIGGGSLTVPFLARCQFTMQRVVATAAACGLPIALAGSLGFLLAGHQAVNLPPGASGYIYWPGFGGLASCSILSAPLGVKLAHCLPSARLKQYFALFLGVLGLKMLLF